MKRRLLLMLFLASHAAGAQEANPGMRELRTQVIGWAAQLPPKGNAATPARAAGNPSYNAARQAMMADYAAWIRQSYPAPVGAVAEPWFEVYPEKANPKFYMPTSWSTNLRFWNPAYADASRNIARLKPAQPAASYDIRVGANVIPGLIGTGWFDTPTALYVTFPASLSGEPTDPEAAAVYAEPLAQARRVTDGRLTYLAGQSIHVLLGIDHIPLTPITRRQALDVAEAGCRRANAKGDNPDDALARQLQVIERTRNKYRDSLDQPAALNTEQFGPYAFDGTGDADYDPFGAGFKGVRWPIYTIAPEIYAGTRSNTPMWMSVSFPAVRLSKIGPDTPSGPSQTAIWKVMTERFNYDAVQQLGLSPEQAKSSRYTPRSGD
ncbi:hypothetical protein SAMN05428989_1833 [Pseudoxanthomonas sp. GM95]|uniref:hypothetical protein n=1 Tax=Pseudoxanthomonas sp. GM95 TaxID=1881043 RepID=UPI0008BB4FC1|nr:hypothetical protein [Pseudoxanthomonas sp. GM95]SEL51993.1 hypothetical protein SAMN05428989_1833 [Pseudoxanthomonas sp. GM95]